MSIYRATINDVKAAKKMYIAGWFLLPWVWALCFLHFRERAKDPTEIGEKLKKWTVYSGIGASVALLITLTWVIYFQMFWKSRGLENLLVYNPDPDGTW